MLYLMVIAIVQPILMERNNNSLFWLVLPARFIKKISSIFLKMRRKILTVDQLRVLRLSLLLLLWLRLNLRLNLILNSRLKWHQM